MSNLPKDWLGKVLEEASQRSRINGLSAFEIKVMLAALRRYLHHLRDQKADGFHADPWIQQVGELIEKLKTPWAEEAVAILRENIYSPYYWSITTDEVRLP